MSKKRTSELSAQDLQKLKKGDFTVRHVKEEDIDCSDLPELTSKQLQKFRRLGTAPISESTRDPKQRRKPGT